MIVQAIFTMYISFVKLSGTMKLPNLTPDLLVACAVHVIPIQTSISCSHPSLVPHAF